MEKARTIIFYTIFFLFSLAFFITADRYDYDLWARLIAGMGVVHTGHVLKADFLSYTPTHIWYDHEWGSGVVFYIVQHFFSSAGLVILQSLLMFLIFFVVTKTIELRKVQTTHPYNFLFYYFAFAAMAYLMNSPVRCQMFSFLFFAIFLYILELSRQKETKLLWVLPVLMIIWNNLHGGCVSGLGLIGMYIVGEALNKKPFKKYILPLVLSFAVLIINPWGMDYIKFLLHATTMPRPLVMEWWGLFTPYFIHKFFKYKLFASVLLTAEVIFLIKSFIKKTFSFDFTKFIVICATLYLAIEHVKLVPLSVIALSVFLYDDFYTIFNSLTKNIFNKIAPVKDAIIYLLILAFALLNINSRLFNPILKRAVYPNRAIEFIKINDIKGNLLVNFGLGSFASYKTYPHNKIYMDGRYEEVYYDSEMNLFKKLFLVQGEDWAELLVKYPPDVIIVENYYPIYNTLKTGFLYQPTKISQTELADSYNTGIKHNQDWTAVFEDETFGVFVPTRKLKDKYKRPTDDWNYYKNTLFDTEIKTVLKSRHE